MGTSAIHCSCVNSIERARRVLRKRWGIQPDGGASTEVLLQRFLAPLSSLKIPPQYVHYISSHHRPANRRSKLALPFLLMWFSSLVQLTYGIRNADPWEIPVHGVVVAITSIYAILYFRYITAAYRFAGYIMFASMVIILGFWILVEFTVWGAYNKDATVKTKRDQLQGEMVVVVALCTYCTPFKEVWAAFKTHEVGVFDIWLSLAFLGNSIVGVVSAFLPINPFEIFVGSLGLVCTLGQCVVWARCHFHEHHIAQHPVVQLVGR